MKIRKGDTVIITQGKDKNKIGKVIAAFPKKSMVVVEGINIKKRHQKISKTNPKGGIIEFSAPLPASKVRVICSACNKATRIKYINLQDGTRSRACSKCNQAIVGEG